jgi:hypothetical protein
MNSERCISRIKFAIQNPIVWYLIAVAVFLTLILTGCTAYNPSLFQGYDLLSPNAEVKKNPIGVTADGNFIVNADFMMWVFELKAEVLRLRKGK